MNRVVIACVTGPTGVGKTDASWALLGLGAPMVLLDCDWFAARVPFSWQAPEDVRSVFDAVGDMLRFHIGRGSTRFVIPLTVEMATSFSAYREAIELCDRSVLKFRLCCHIEMLRRRIGERDRSVAQKAHELSGLHLQIAAAERISGEFQTIDNTQLSELATAEVIWQAFKSAEMPDVA